MESYYLFLLISIVTVFSPGPGVMLSLTNAIRYGVSGAVGGILGLAFGSLFIAALSASSLGFILATSVVAFNVMKWIGAAYLIYLGIKLWRSPVMPVSLQPVASKNYRQQFVEGLMLQLSNPKVVFFYMSIFPQFIDYTSDYMGQFILLVLTYSGLLVIIHFFYAILARSASSWFSSDKGGRMINRLGGGTFMCFGIGLAAASR